MQGLRRSAVVAGCLAGLAMPASAAAQPLDGDGMWIWQLKRSSGGSVNRIATKAARYGIDFVVIKGGDGRHRWTQLSPWLVSQLHLRGLRVCGYQFVYGSRPRREARVGARIAATGVDCLLIDAEGAYEGHYRQARIYMRALRRRVGPAYPIGLTSFPYVHYHPGFPYSVFLGPGGAQFNVPQIYWKTIGTRVDRAWATTYRYNRVYGKPIYPLGQVYGHPPRRQIFRFRQLAAANGAGGLSWWSWQSARRRDWRSVAVPFTPLSDYFPIYGWPKLRVRSRGDLVVWAQLHLRAAGQPIRLTGRFRSGTRRAVVNFQSTHGLPAVGSIGPRTWQALLAFPLPPVASANGGPVPRSARLPAVRNELGSRRGR
ncbi:MAG: peptidoglycan-binding protein [Thermoleophilaceae bacterium]